MRDESFDTWWDERCVIWHMMRVFEAIFTRQLILLSWQLKHRKYMFVIHSTNLYNFPGTKPSDFCQYSSSFFLKASWVFWKVFFLDIFINERNSPSFEKYYQILIFKKVFTLDCSLIVFSIMLLFICTFYFKSYQSSACCSESS